MRSSDAKRRLARILDVSMTTHCGMPPEVCDCCGRPNKNGRKLAWDHDHATGDFRGWLCHSCNVTLGQVADNVEHLAKLIAYLSKSRVSAT